MFENVRVLFAAIVGESDRGEANLVVLRIQKGTGCRK